MGLHVNPCESTCWCMHVPPPSFLLSAAKMSLFHMYVISDHSVEMGRGGSAYSPCTLVYDVDGDCVFQNRGDEKKKGSTVLGGGDKLS